jgi:hypothetical protein
MGAERRPQRADPDGKHILSVREADEACRFCLMEGARKLRMRCLRPCV